MTPPWRYRLLLRVLSPLLLIYTLWRASRDGGWRYLRQRLGIFTHEDHRSESDLPDISLWVHAASVGEIITVLPLVRAWKHSRPQARVLVTTNTPTGAAVLMQQSLDGVYHQYLPLDLPGATQRFLAQHGCQRGWIVETEIWPWLYAHCRRCGVDLTIVNGRLSSRTSSQSGGVLASSYRAALSGVRILARSQRDAEGFMQLGALPTQVQTIGNLKLADAANPTDNPRPIEREYVLAASTHDDEEMQLARAWRELGGTRLLVIVPRHPGRGHALQRSLSEITDPVRRRGRGETPGPHDRFYLADTLGEMQAWYQYAAAAFVGGSLISRGGHNMLEAASHGCPTVVGPHTGNFEDVMQLLLQAEAIAVVDTAAEVVSFLDRAANSDPGTAAMALRARQVAEQGRHVVQCYLQVLD